MNGIMARVDDLQPTRAHAGDINDYCRLCANIGDNMVPIYADEGADHGLEIKIKTHLPFLNICIDDILPKRICYHCASAVLVWDELYELSSAADSKLRNWFESSVYDQRECKTVSSYDVIGELSAETVEFEDISDVNLFSKSDKPVKTLNDLGKISNTIKSVNIIGHELKSSVIQKDEKLNSDDLKSDMTDLFGGAVHHVDEVGVPMVDGHNLYVMDDEEDINRLMDCRLDMSAVDCSGGGVLLKREYENCDDAVQVAGVMDCCEDEDDRNECEDDRIECEDDQIECEDDQIECEDDQIECEDDRIECEDDRGNESEDIGDDVDDDKIELQYKFKTMVPSESLRFEEEQEEEQEEEGVEEEQEMEEEEEEDEGRPVVGLREAYANGEYDDTIILGETMCQICATVFKTRYNLLRHLQKRHPEHRMYECDLCRISYPSMEEFKDHLERRHSRTHTTQSLDSKQVRFACDVCGNMYKNKASAMNHLLTHTAKKTVRCGQCDFACYTKQQLGVHQTKHDKRFECDICHKRFAQKSQLDVHVNAVHYNHRPFACVLCKKTFKTKGSHDAHMIVHTDTRNYQCPHCDKKCRKRYDLTLHIRTHTGEKPFKCSVCGRGFVQMCDTRKHEMLHFRRGKQQRKSATGPQYSAVPVDMVDDVHLGVGVDDE